MFRLKRKSNYIFSLLVILVLALFVNTGAIGAEPAPQTVQQDSGSLNLNIVKGKVTGEVDQRPLTEVLKTVFQNEKSSVKVHEELTDFPVSGKFKQTPLVDMVKTILKPFNYILLVDEQGSIRLLSVLSFQSDYYVESEPEKLSTATAGQLKPQNKLTPHLVKMTEEERQAMEIAKQNIGPSPELMDQFYPEQEPGTELTGPGGADDSDSSLPTDQFPLAEDSDSPLPPGKPLTLDEMDLTEEERAAFEITNQQVGPPPELMDQFYPEQEPGTELTGPTMP